MVTEWITSGNLKYYNFVDAFHNLKKLIGDSIRIMY